MKNKKYLVLTFISVPIYMQAVRYTEGSILPSLPGMEDVWNIQYCAPILIALINLIFLFKFFSLEKDGFLVIVAEVWNLVLVVFFAIIIVQLWGDLF